jgi:hypothetical protein
MEEREKKGMQHTQREKGRIDLERSEHDHSFLLYSVVVDEYTSFYL